LAEKGEVAQGEIHLVEVDHEVGGFGGPVRRDPVDAEIHERVVQADVAFQRQSSEHEENQGEAGGEAAADAPVGHAVAGEMIYGAEDGGDGEGSEHECDPVEAARARFRVGGGRRRGDGREGRGGKEAERDSGGATSGGWLERGHDWGLKIDIVTARVGLNRGIQAGSGHRFAAGVALVIRFRARGGASRRAI